MEAIKIVVFILGMFFGVKTTTVIPEKTTVTITPSTNTVVIQQENLLAIYPTKKNSHSVAEEFSTIYKKQSDWDSQLDTFAEKSIVYSSPKEGTLNATITLKYSKTEDLKTLAIDVNREGKFSIINIPTWHIETKDGKLNENYWNFESDKEFSLTLSPVKNVPETYTINRELLFSTWQKLTKE